MADRSIIIDANSLISYVYYSKFSNLLLEVAENGIY